MYVIYIIFSSDFPGQNYSRIPIKVLLESFLEQTVDSGTTLIPVSVPFSILVILKYIPKSKLIAQKYDSFIYV